MFACLQSDLGIMQRKTSRNFELLFGKCHRQLIKETPISIQTIFNTAHHFYKRITCNLLEFIKVYRKVLNLLNLLSNRMYSN